MSQNTIESDNKRRPIVLRRNASKYDPPPPEPPDPNSGMFVTSLIIIFMYKNGVGRLLE